MSLPLSFDHQRLFSTGDPLSKDLSPSDLEALRPRLKLARESILAKRSEGAMGFMALHEDEQMLNEVAAFADEKKGQYEDIVVWGIGGSALGAKAVYQALDDLHANMVPDRGHPRLFIIENTDPAQALSVLRLINPAKTLGIIISKSGGTLETMSTFLAFKGALEAAHGPEYTKHLVIITDPEKGFLRKWATDEGISSFPVPGNVGGRFSVFSPVGLVPLALAGVDVRGLLAGQRSMDGPFATDDDHPALLLGGLMYLLDMLCKRNQLVMMPYADNLKETTFWFRQLWAESLGKARHADGSTARVGTTPVFAIGATDQHSQMQLYMEGPADKSVLFLEVASPREDVSLKAPGGPLAALDYLDGRSLHELLQIELNATRDALTEAGKPNASFALPKLDAQGLGALMYTLMAATAVAGELYFIDAFDQPGVEAAKIKINAALGK